MKLQKDDFEMHFVQSFWVQFYNFFLALSKLNFNFNVNFWVIKVNRYVKKYFSYKKKHFHGNYENFYVVASRNSIQWYDIEGSSAPICSMFLTSHLEVPRINFITIFLWLYITKLGEDFTCIWASSPMKLKQRQSDERKASTSNLRLSYSRTLWAATRRPTTKNQKTTSCHLLTSF